MCTFNIRFRPPCVGSNDTVNQCILHWFWMYTTLICQWFSSVGYTEKVILYTDLQCRIHWLCKYYMTYTGTRQPPAKSGQILWAPLETQFPLNMLRFMEIYT